jgi:hypothetical protein
MKKKRKNLAKKGYHEYQIGKAYSTMDTSNKQKNIHENKTEKSVVPLLLGVHVRSSTRVLPHLWPKIIQRLPQFITPGHC